MLTAELDAVVSWPNEVRLQGLVKMNYLSDVDPWLVHLTFVVADARDDLEVERLSLMRIGMVIKTSQWLNVAGAPFRLAVGDSFVRMRLTNQEDGTWVDFDVKRKDMQKFLQGTTDQVDYPSEKAALDAYIEKALGDL